MNGAPFRAVHVGDLHFWSFVAAPHSLAGKRLLGVGNLAWKRSRHFHQREAPALAARLLELRPDLALFSGDFSTTSLRAEFLSAFRHFQPLSDATGGRLWCVPGNHDRYTARELHPARARFDSVLGGWRPGRHPHEAGRRPWIRAVGDGVVVIGLDATASNGLGSHGAVRPALVEHLRAWWSHFGRRVRELWILCHFPAEDPPGLVHQDRGPQLHRASLLLDWIAEAGVPAFFLPGLHLQRWLQASPSVPGLVYLNAGAPMLRRGSAADLGFFEILRADGKTAFRLHWREGSRWLAAPVAVPAAGKVVDLQGAPAPSASR